MGKQTIVAVLAMTGATLLALACGDETDDTTGSNNGGSAGSPDGGNGTTTTTTTTMGGSGGTGGTGQGGNPAGKMLCSGVVPCESGNLCPATAPTLNAACSMAQSADGTCFYCDDPTDATETWDAITCDFMGLNWTPLPTFCTGS
jgi:hypothetical protein